MLVRGKAGRAGRLAIAFDLVSDQHTVSELSMAFTPSWRDRRRTTPYGQHVDVMRILDMYAQLSAPLPQVPNVHPLSFGSVLRTYL